MFDFHGMVTMKPWYGDHEVCLSRVLRMFDFHGMVTMKTWYGDHVV